MYRYLIDKIIPFIIPFVIIGVFLSIAIYSDRKKRKALRKLSDSLKGSVSRYIFNFTPSFSGTYQGLNFKILLIPGSRSSPDYLLISVYRKTSFRLSIRRESILSGMGKKIGVVHEVKVNDEAFNKEFLIFSNRPDYAVQYLNIENRMRISELFNLGYDNLSIDGKQILIKKPYYSIEFDLEPKIVTDVLQKLSFLANKIIAV